MNHCSLSISEGSWEVRFQRHLKFWREMSVVDVGRAKNILLSCRSGSFSRKAVKRNSPAEHSVSATADFSPSCCQDAVTRAEREHING